MRPKLIVSDIDGTLLPAGCEPDSPEVREGIQELRKLIAEEKLQFTLASGRSSVMMRPLWEALGLDLPVICCNGAAAGIPAAEANDMEGASGSFSAGKQPEEAPLNSPLLRKEQADGRLLIGELWDERLSPQLIRPAVELADSLGMAVIVTDGRAESVYRENAYTKKHAEAEHKWNLVYRPETEEAWQAYRLQKLLIIDPNSPGRVDEVIAALRETERRLSALKQATGSISEPLSGEKQVLEGERTGHLCEIVRYDDRGVEIMPAGCTKESGVRRFCKRLGISLSEVLVCGDNQNDVGMFREAGLSAAVGNASDAAKQAASYICRSKSVYGVLEAVRYFLKGE